MSQTDRYADGSQRVVKMLVYFASALDWEINQEDWRNRVTCTADLHHGEPCIRGTGLAVSVIVASLADVSIDDLLIEYRQLTREDVTAALLYAAEAAHSTLVA